MENPQYLVQEGKRVAVKQQGCGWIQLHPKTGLPIYIFDEHRKKVAILDSDGWTYRDCGL